MHYKGVYILVLWARKRWFYVGYHWQGSAVRRKFPNNGTDTSDVSEAELKSHIAALLDEVDREKPDVPDDFWPPQYR